MDRKSFVGGALVGGWLVWLVFDERDAINFSFGVVSLYFVAGLLTWLTLSVILWAIRIATFGRKTRDEALAIFQRSTAWVDRLWRIVLASVGVDAKSAWADRGLSLLVMACYVALLLQTGRVFNMIYT